MHIRSSRTPQRIPGLPKRNDVGRIFLIKRTRRVALGFGRSLFSSLPLLLVCLAAANGLRADTISGTIKDPSGAVVAGARIEIKGGNLTQAMVFTSDESGKFTAPDLSAEKYTVRVSKEGFEELLTSVELHGTADLPLKLTIAEQQTSINVTEQSLALANSYAFYP